MIVILGGLALLALIWGPSAWAQRALRVHARERPDLPGTGGELARHLLDRAGLETVVVEKTEIGDHYDPEAKAVRLTERAMEGRSITAVATAAHEVAHALQDKRSEPMLAWRTRLAKSALVLERIARVIMLAAPLLIAVSPRLAAAQAAFAIVVMASRVVIHLITLPVELDASFEKALPILERGDYLSEADLPAARSVLRACAFTYVAAALFSIIDILRWLRVGR